MKVFSECKFQNFLGLQKCDYKILLKLVDEDIRKRGISKMGKDLKRGNHTHLWTIVYENVV